MWCRAFFRLGGCPLTFQRTNVPKLRTYVRYKIDYHTEPYLYKVLDRGHISILSQFRTGILPLSIETGRYTSIPEEFRLCLLCNANAIENEEHFLFSCSFYDELRESFFTDITQDNIYFDTLTINDKFKVLMCENNVKRTAKFLYNAFQRRRNTLFK